MQKQVKFVIWIVCGTLILLSVPASAATINSTTVLGNQVTIGGTGFIGTLSVMLNNQRLTIVSSTTTQIVANMNPVFAAGAYRLVVKAGSTSATSSVTIPASSIVVAQCLQYTSSGPGQTFWLLGDQPCDQGWNYPPYAGVPFPAGVLSNLRVMGEFAGTGTVFVNSIPTALSCTITDNTGYDSACSNLSDQVVLNAGDELNLGITPTVQGTSTIRVTFEFQGKSGVSRRRWISSGSCGSSHYDIAR